MEKFICWRLATAAKFIAIDCPFEPKNGQMKTENRGVDERSRVRLSRKAAMEDRDKEMAAEAPKA